MHSRPKLYCRRPQSVHAASFQDTEDDAKWMAAWAELFISDVRVYERLAWGSHDCWVVEVYVTDTETLEVVPGQHLVHDLDANRFFVMSSDEFESTFEEVAGV